MTTAVIVQARMDSTRLPGKILEYLGRKTALARCLDRCKRIPGIDMVVAAVPFGADNDLIAEEASDHGVMVTRGPEDDVLARYALAAKEADADTVMRVTSDCPFIDPTIAGGVLALLRDTGVDYASNSMPPLFPHGLDCEAFPAEWLYRADRDAREPAQREHVTPWIRTHADAKRANLRGPGGGLEQMRWTLDRPEDLAFFQAIYAELGEAAAFAPAAQIAGLCLRRPDLVAINAACVDGARLTAEPPEALQTAPVRLMMAA